MGVGRIESIKTTLEVSIQTMLQVSMDTILKHSMKIKSPIFYLISNFDFIYRSACRDSCWRWRAVGGQRHGGRGAGL